MGTPKKRNRILRNPEVALEASARELPRTMPLNCLTRPQSSREAFVHHTDRHLAA